MKTLEWVWFSLLVGVAVVAVVVLNSPPVTANELVPAATDPTPFVCESTIGQAVEGLRANRGVFLSLTDVAGIGYDQVMLGTVGETLIAGLALEGCMVSGPQPLGPVVPWIEG